MSKGANESKDIAKQPKTELQIIQERLSNANEMHVDLVRKLEVIFERFTGNETDKSPNECPDYNGTLGKLHYNLDVYNYQNERLSILIDNLDKLV